MSSKDEEQRGKVPVMTDGKDLASRLDDVGRRQEEIDVGRRQEESHAVEGQLRQELVPLSDQRIVSDKEPSIAHEVAWGAQVPGAAALAHEDATFDSLREGWESQISALDEGLLREAESVGQSRDGGRQVDARLQQIRQKDEEREWKDAMDLAHDGQPTSLHWSR